MPAYGTVWLPRTKEGGPAVAPARKLVSSRHAFSPNPPPRPGHVTASRTSDVRNTLRRSGENGLFLTSPPPKEWFAPRERNVTASHTVVAIEPSSWRAEVGNMCDPEAAPAPPFSRAAAGPGFVGSRRRPFSLRTFSASGREKDVFPVYQRAAPGVTRAGWFLRRGSNWAAVTGG